MIQKATRRISRFIAAALFSASAIALAHPGDVDTHFGNAGQQSITPAAGGTVYYGPLAIDHNGRILSGGINDSNGIIVALKSDGNLDTTFGTGGFDHPDFQVDAMAVDFQNRVLVVTTDYINGSLNVTRYQHNGSVDASFGTAGVEKIPNGDSRLGAGVVLDNAGNIFVCALAINNAADQVVLVAKFDSSGKPSKSFGNNGVSTPALLPVGTELSVANALALDDFGNIVVAGYTTLISGDIVNLVVRFKHDGSVDKSFNGSGFVEADAVPTMGSSRYTFSKAVTIDDLDRIIVAGGAGIQGGNSKFFALRYRYDGKADPSFNAGKPFLGNTAEGQAASVMIDSKNKIVMTGVIQASGSATALTAYRLNESGSLDTSFGAGNGEAVVSGGNFGGSGALTRNGDVLLFGMSSNLTSFVWASLSEKSE